MSSVAVKTTVAVALTLVAAATLAIAVLAPVEAKPKVRLCPTADLQCPTRSGVSGA